MCVFMVLYYKMTRDMPVKGGGLDWGRGSGRFCLVIWECVWSVKSVNVASSHHAVDPAGVLVVAGFIGTVLLSIASVVV